MKACRVTPILTDSGFKAGGFLVGPRSADRTGRHFEPVEVGIENILLSVGGYLRFADARRSSTLTTGVVCVRAVDPFGAALATALAPVSQ